MDQFNMTKSSAWENYAPIFAVVGKRAEEEFRATGRTDRGFAVLNDDKVTFGGKCFVKKGRSYDEQRVNWSVSANEILGCTYTRFTNYAMMVLMIVFPVLGFAGLFSSALIPNDAIRIWIPFCLSLIPFSSMFVVRFIKSRRSFFEITMQGMSICIEMRSLERGEDILFSNAIQEVRARNFANTYH